MGIQHDVGGGQVSSGSSVLQGVQGVQALLLEGHRTGVVFAPHGGLLRCLERLELTRDRGVLLSQMLGPGAPSQLVDTPWGGA